MPKISFSIDLEPKSLQQGAHRQRISKAKSGKAFIQHYTDRGAQNFQRSVAFLVAEHRPPAPLEGPLRVTYTFVQARPGRLDRKKDTDERIWCDKTPDYTNLAKGFEDVLTKAGFWFNDGQLADARSLKFYAARVPFERPHIEVEIETLA